jgi:hypothetical protein
MLLKKATNRLRESAEFELHELIAKKPKMFESLVGKQIASLETEIRELEKEANRLNKEIGTLTSCAVPGEI